jgi:hypothetical protein
MARALRTGSTLRTPTHGSRWIFACCILPVARFTSSLCARCSGRSDARRRTRPPAPPGRRYPPHPAVRPTGGLPTSVVSAVVASCPPCAGFGNARVDCRSNVSLSHLLPPAHACSVRLTPCVRICTPTFLTSGLAVQCALGHSAMRLLRDIYLMRDIHTLMRIFHTLVRIFHTLMRPGPIRQCARFPGAVDAAVAE